MKVTQVAICPSEASQRAGRPALTPELLAASGARYSRNNDGLESILSKVDPANLEKSVDSIFRMVDYGHQSIADMVPVALFIDGLSMWAAYYVWSLCPSAGGQESSTRYLKLSVDELIAPEKLGLPEKESAAWRQVMSDAFQSYQASLAIWEELALENPSLTAIPKSLLNDSSEASQKKVARMRRNFAFDRARYFLPVAAATNMMLVMSARGWVHLCQHLLSHRLPELQQLGGSIRGELQLAAPRMLKHAVRSDPHREVLAREFEQLVHRARREEPVFTSSSSAEAASPYLSLLPPENTTEDQLIKDLAYHINRYAPVGSTLQRIGVRFGWPVMAFAEIRDLNRHRTGTKYSPQLPKGFYFALDQLPASAPGLEGHRAKLLAAAEKGQSASAQASRLLREAEPSYIYWALLGTEFPFEHVTTADKFIYEAELRTGLGAHYRYAKHLHDALVLWYSHFPGTKGLILEGSAEPE